MVYLRVSSIFLNIDIIEDDILVRLLHQGFWNAFLTTFPLYFGKIDTQSKDNKAYKSNKYNSEEGDSLCIHIYLIFTLVRYNKTGWTSNPMDIF